jgi:hypothetical protein
VGFTVLHFLGYWQVFALAALVFLTAAGSSVLLDRHLFRALKPES